jgi:hypothetical protein
MIMTGMRTMVHEHMHQGTGCDQQPGQHAKDMRGVLGDQEKTAHPEETKGDETNRRQPPRPRPITAPAGIVRPSRLLGQVRYHDALRRKKL